MATFSTVFNKSVILLVLVGTSVEDARAECARQKPETADSRLRAKSMSNDPLNRYFSPKSNDTIDVQLGLVLRKINFDEKADKLEIHSWFIVQWKDCRLAWDPSSYDNIAEIHLPSYYIWKPDLADFTTTDLAKTFPLFRAYQCTLRSDGSVRCHLPHNHVMPCSANLRHWPYDTHTCKMKIGSWSHTGEQLNISAMIIPGEKYFNREWKITSMESYQEIKKYDCCPDDTYRSVRFEFTLQRHSGTYSSTVIMPAIVLMLLTLVTFWMEPAGADRLVLAVLNLVSHILFLQHLGKLLPANGDQTPVIITFYRDSMFLAAMALFTSAVMPDLTASTMDLPFWVSGVSNLVLQNQFGQVFFVQKLINEDAGAVPDTSGGQDTVGFARPSWTLFASLIDFACFVVSLISYAVLLVGYIQ